MAAALILAALTAAVRPDGALLRLAAFAALVAATGLLARAPARGAAGLARDWLPIGAVLATYLLLEPVIEATVPWRLDAALAAIDARLLGPLVAAWRGALGRPAAFTDAMYVAYFSYYLLPVTAAWLAWRRGPAQFERAARVLLLGFYLTFLGYLLLPASGPRLAAGLDAQALGGGAASEAVRAFLRAAEATTLDAFPSGHAAIALLSAACGARLVRPAAAAGLWLWALAVVFSTVYIHVHYAIDIVAGIALAALVLVVERAWRRREPRGAG
jgi:membrane-associated phospholipid phosphatase